MLLEGLHIPLTTPFHPDGRLHLHKLAANVIRYSKSPAQGLIALAPHAGEPTLLDDQETAEALQTVANAAAAEKVLLAHISRDSVQATLALAEVANLYAYDAVLVGVPSILRPKTDENSEPDLPEALLYFRTVADRSPLPLVLLATSARPLSAEILAALIPHPNIIGMLDATPHLPSSWSLPQVVATASSVHRDVTVTTTFAPVTRRMLRNAVDAELTEQPQLISAASLARNPAAAATAAPATPKGPPLRTRTRRVGFQVIAAAPPQLLDALKAGATAIAPAFAACAPQASYEVFAAWKDGNDTLASEKQQRLSPAALLAEELGASALKFGCDLNGYFGGMARLPYLPLTGTQRAELQQVMGFLRS